MSNYNATKGKHLTMEDRIIIEHSLDQNYPLKLIEQNLEKDPTTISKEIKRNKTILRKVLEGKKLCYAAKAEKIVPKQIYVHLIIAINFVKNVLL